MKAPPPLLGFNNNVKHKGRVFHIQTEDSGVKHPHVITHLYADGGRILKTTKTSYAEHVGEGNLHETVRRLMQEQHKAMFIALRDGQLDHLVEAHIRGSAPAAGRDGATSAPPGDGPSSSPGRDGGSAAVAEPPAAPRAEGSAPGGSVPIAPLVAAERTSPPLDGRRAAPHAPLASAAGATDEAPPIARGAAPLAPQPPHHAAQPPTFMAPRKATPRPAAPAATRDAPSATSGAALDLDLDALERAANESQMPYFERIDDLPPPPAAVLGKRTTPGAATDTSYRSITPPTPTAPQPPASSSDPSASSAAAAHADGSGATNAGGTGRYAAARPPAIFSTPRPPAAPAFGDDLISEKSLDEVILSYLAEDLEAPPPKK